MMGEKVFPTHLAALLISGRVNGNGLGNADLPQGICRSVKFRSFAACSTATATR